MLVVHLTSVVQRVVATLRVKLTLRVKQLGALYVEDALYGLDLLSFGLL